MTKRPSQPGKAARTKIEGVFNGSTAGSRPAAPADKARNGDLARIHCLKRDLGIDQDTYRDVLWVQGQVTSAAELDGAGRAKLIAHMTALLPKSKAQYPGRPHNTDAAERADLRKIEALLTDAGKPWAYAEAMLKHMSRGRKVRMEFAGASERSAIIAALHKAAIKRLTAEMEVVFGEGWASFAGKAAALLFDFDAMRCSIEAYPEPMSKVLRWWRGELEAACQWPPRDRNLCCGGCCHKAGL